MPTVVSGKPAAERGVASDVDALLADLHDATHDHVLDEGGIDAVSLHERAQHLSGEVDRVLILQLPVPTTERRAKGVDDNGVGHDSLHGFN